MGKVNDPGSSKSDGLDSAVQLSEYVIIRIEKADKCVGGNPARKAAKGTTMRNYVGNFEFGQNQMRSRKLPFFSKLNKFRGIMYSAEWIWPRRPLQQWRGIFGLALSIRPR